MTPQSGCTRTPYITVSLPCMNLFCILLPMMIGEAVRKTFASAGSCYFNVVFVTKKSIKVFIYSFIFKDDLSNFGEVTNL